MRIWDWSSDVCSSDLPEGPQGDTGPEGSQGPEGPGGGGSELAVEYDDTGNAAVTLGGTDGPVVSNVADGVAAGDAVNKGQLDANRAGTLVSANDHADNPAQDMLSQPHAPTHHTATEQTAGGAL